jgi:hypothetical protein
MLMESTLNFGFDRSSKEAALMKASDLYHRQRAELYEIEGPNGRALRKEEIMRWMSANKSQLR